MCLDVTLWADAVICDYNYLFDPTVHLKRFFDGGKKNKYCLLIDEAHNLVERAREMYSAELIKEDVLEAKQALRTGTDDGEDSAGAAKDKGRKAKKQDPEQMTMFTDQGEGTGNEAGSAEHRDSSHGKTIQARERVAAGLEAVNKALNAFKRETDGFQVWDGCDKAVLAAERFCGLYEELSRDLKLDSEKARKVRDVYFSARHFLNMDEGMEDDYEIYSNFTAERHFRLRLQCMDPSRQLKNMMALSDSVVLFSATLLPIGYYRDQLGAARRITRYMLLHRSTPRRGCS
ncbi:MAG: hypothetical protein K6E85_07500 [Lachnospiraceae bacterium]|nr:hypothetical protein [Lachnospiraceae bacterium]